MKVLSKSVADSFASMRELSPENQVWKSSTETERFCRVFDKFFDCLNTRNLMEAKQKRKSNLRGYFSPKDSRLEV